MLERGVTPVIPEKKFSRREWRPGAIGPSGSAMIGEGEAFYHGERLPSAESLRRAGIQPLELEVKEGLALLNGTQAMAAVGAMALYG